MWPREEVGVMALGNGEEFSARVKCFPLYSLLLAAQHRKVDFLSLSCGGCEIDVLYSLPKDKVDYMILLILFNFSFITLFFFFLFFSVSIAIVEIFGKEILVAEVFL